MNRLLAALAVVVAAFVTTWFVDQKTTAPNAEQTVPAPLAARAIDAVPEDARRDLYSRYLRDTFQGLDKQRGATGLVNDTVWICGEQPSGESLAWTTEARTGPTNVGLDLVILVHRAVAGDSAAITHLETIIATLRRIPRHEPTGLFFRTYWPDDGRPHDVNLSSIDNLHLAYGLWVVAKIWGLHDAELGARATQILAGMDFSVFLNEETDLIGGNLRPVHPHDGRGPYQRDSYDYKYFGSESRSLYTLAFALGLYREIERRGPESLSSRMQAAIEATDVETTRIGGSGPLLRTWDGGAFQALLPALMMPEESLSPALGRLHGNYARHVINSPRVHGAPAAHSASAFAVRGIPAFRSGDSSFDRNLPDYNGKSGHPELVATINADITVPAHRRYWDLVYTPHAAFMAASQAPDDATAGAFAAMFQDTEQLSSPATCRCQDETTCTCALKSFDRGPAQRQEQQTRCAPASGTNSSLGSNSLYVPGRGWMDGYYVDGPFRGRVVPVQISLDQAMIALAALRLSAPHGRHVGIDALRNDDEVWRRLQEAYGYVEAKLRRTID